MTTFNDQIATKLAATLSRLEGKTTRKESPMRNPDHAQLALECLRLAHNPDFPGDDVVSRATAYFAFVTGEQSPREQVIAAMDAAGVK